MSEAIPDQVLQPTPKPTFWQGLLQFLKQYSVIGLAIGVITAQASKDVVDAIVVGIFTPLVKIIMPSGFSSLTLKLGGQIFDFGLILKTGLTFIIVMVFLYFVIRTILRSDRLLEKK